MFGRLRNVFVGLILGAILSPGLAAACTCIVPGTPAEELGRSTAAFVGVVRGVVAAPEGDGRFERRMRLFRFDVLGAWKGVLRQSLYVRTGSGGGDCGYEFAPGGIYLVYAHGSSPSDTLATSICTRTRPFQGAAEDLSVLAAPSYTPIPVAEWHIHAPPRRCPRHPEAPVRESRPMVLFGLPQEAAAEYVARMDLAFPFAGAELDPAMHPALGALPNREFACGLCREGVLDWAHANGMPCRPGEAPAGAKRTPPAAAFEDGQYRRAYPDRSFGFVFDDGRRLRLDTFEGRLTRRYGTLPDTAITFVLADSTMRRLYDQMIVHRAFDRDEPHPPYPAHDPAAEPPCTWISLQVRSHTIVRDYRWEAARAPRGAPEGDSWAGLGAVMRAIVEAIVAHPAYVALPVRDP